MKLGSFQRQQLVHEERTDKTTGLSTDCDIKYQDFEYTLITRGRAIFYDEHKKIDFSLAVQELQSLDYTLYQNGISIVNVNTNQNIFSHRADQDKWWVTTPIKLNGIWTGHEWATSTNTESLTTVLEFFFQDIPWFDLLDWKKVNWNNDYAKYR